MDAKKQDVKVNFRECLLKFREMRQLTQQEVAEGSKVALRAYQNYERALQEPPLSALLALADFYRVSLDELTGREPYRARPETVKEETVMAAGTMTIHMDRELLDEAKDVFEDFGLDIETAVRIFLKQTVREQGLPFRIGDEPNSETVSALESVKYGIGLSKGFTSIAELKEALNADD